jgi:hypothetical protein
LATAVQEAMEKASGPGAKSFCSTYGDADPMATLANVSSFYVKAMDDTGVDGFVAELQKAEADAQKQPYMSGLIAADTFYYTAPRDVKGEGFRKAGWILLVSWPSCHSGATAAKLYYCRLWFKQIKNLEHKTIRHRRPKPLPEWCVQEQVEEKKKTDGTGA